MAEVTILTGDPVDVVDPIYVCALFSAPGVLTGGGLPVGPGKVRDVATGKAGELS